MYDALLLDFYGTVVHEDDDIVASICRTIATTSAIDADPIDIGRHWWRTFSDAFMTSHGERFATQRELEHRSLEATIEHFRADGDPQTLCALLFEHWTTSPMFEDARRFLAAIDLPVVILSNIDRADLESCLALYELRVQAIVTSDDVRAYKPHPAMFDAGLAATGISDRRRVLHIGDSSTSDVAGANAASIPVAWVNRTHKPPTPSATPDHTVTTLTELLPIVDRRV